MICVSGLSLQHAVEFRLQGARCGFVPSVMCQEDASTILERGVQARECRMLDEDPAAQLAAFLDGELEHPLSSTTLRYVDPDQADRTHAEAAKLRKV